MYTCKCHNTYFIVKTKICQGDNTFVHLDKQLKKGWEGGLSIFKKNLDICVCVRGRDGRGGTVIGFYL